MRLRPYQVDAVERVIWCLDQLKICYLAGEVRTGKTLVAICAAHDLRFKSVLFVTKKKAIKSIENDLAQSGCTFTGGFDIINYEQLNKVTRLYSLIIYDEAHTLGSFPKPSLRAKIAHSKFAGRHVIFLSGTPTPESYSQLFHQFWVTGNLSPWQHKNFYEWAKYFVNKKMVWIKMGLQIPDYSDAKPVVLDTFNQFKVTMTQQEAEFNCDVVEKVHLIPMPDICHQLIKTLKKEKLSESARIITDSGSKLMSAIHQISSGTYIESKADITEPTKRNILSTFKADYIKKSFTGKLAIFYVYIAEGILLRDQFPNNTDNPEDFNQSSNKVFICQIQSGKEGINLSTADHLIFYNIAYSAVAYWQGRARTQSKDGGNKLCHWLFSDKGLEQKIFKVVGTKKSFTKKHFNISDYE